jgi:sugar lactone lactonase YvrE
MPVREFSARTVASGFHFCEAPRWHNGQLYFSDFYGGKVHSLGADGQVRTVCRMPRWVSGLGFSASGDLYMVGVEERKLFRYSGSGKPVEFADLSKSAKFLCNDMLMDEKGRAYVGNFGFDVEADVIAGTELFMVAPNGTVNVVASGLVFPNGMARSADGRTLIVAETFAARLSAFDIQEDGRLTGQRIWANLSKHDFTSVKESVKSGDPLPDGICMDAEGAVWIGDAGGRSALRIAPGGEILARVPTPGLSVYAVALGGADRKTLFLCAARPLFTNDATVEKESVLFSTGVDVPGI